MSSYLVAVLISDFECRGDKAPTMSGEVNVDVCARPNAYNDLDLALEASLSIIGRFEDYFQVEYPLPKLGFFNINIVLDSLHLNIHKMLFILHLRSHWSADI